MNTFSVVFVVPPDGISERLIAALEAQTLPRDRFECVAVLHGPASQDASERLRRSSVDVQPLVLPRGSLGLADALDRGISRARNDVVVLLAADLVPDPAWLEAYAARFEAGDADVLSGQRATLEDEGFELGVRALCQRRPSPVACAYAFASANVAVRKDVLDRTSGFNPCIGALADVELGIRLWEIGARFGLADGAIAARDGAPAPSLPTLDEINALFWRHPYAWILWLEAWRRDRVAGTGLARHTLIELAALADRGDAITEFERAFGSAPPLHGWQEQHAFAASISMSHGIPVAQAERFLDDARTRGVLHRLDGDRVMFDTALALNWIQDTQLSFQYNHLQELFVDDRRVTPFMRTRRASERLVLACRGRYEVTLDADRVGGRECTLDLPLPVSHDRQTGLEIVDCQPATLRDRIDQGEGMIRNVPLASHGGQSLRFSYEFTCRVHEHDSGAHDPASPNAAPTRRSSRHTMLPERPHQRAKELLAHLAIDPRGSPAENARAIYAWIQSNVEFLLRPEVFPYYRVLETGYGDCVAQILLFVKLCTIAGVAARYQCGARFGQFDPTVPHNHLEQRFVGLSPLAHTWAEFYAPDQGWVPIEIQGYGKRRINANNVDRPETRNAIREAMGRFEHEWFGMLSPYRIYASPFSIRGSRGTDHGGAASREILRHAVHTLTCDFERT
jgi:hypothetical protein